MLLRLLLLPPRPCRAVQPPAPLLLPKSLLLWQPAPFWPHLLSYIQASSCARLCRACRLHQPCHVPLLLEAAQRSCRQHLLALPLLLLLLGYPGQKGCLFLLQQH
jgi:hypothetical protein